MIIQRWTWKVKVGHKAEMIELAKAAAEAAGVRVRVCSYIFGPYDAVSSDAEFETEEDRDKYLPHSAHKDFVAMLEPHLEKVLVLDYVARK